MEISKTQYTHCDLVKVSGKIDHSTYASLEESLHETLDSGRFKIVLDMSDVDYMSSAGIRVLATTKAACKGSNRGDLVLACVQPRIRETLELAAISSIFKVYDDVLEAVGNC